MVELTKEQQDFLNQCEEEFKDRYSEKDGEYMKIYLAEPSKPPIVDPWHSMPQRSNPNQGRDRRNWQRHGDRDRDNRERDRGDRDREYRERDYRDRGDRDRERDRHAGKHHLYQRSYRPY